jgi:hypothetical protein
MLIIITTAILSLLAGPIQDDNCTFSVADDDTFSNAMTAFHDVMAELWHGPVQDGNIEPVKEKMAQLISARNRILQSNLPSEFAHNCAGISQAAAALSNSVDALNNSISQEAGTEKVKDTFSEMHDRFRELRVMTVPVSVYMERFHDVMHPLWHDAYPAEDAEAIRKGVDDLVQLAKLIVKSNTGKGEELETGSKHLLDMVNNLKTACADTDDAAVLEALKIMHDAYHALSETH